MAVSVGDIVATLKADTSQFQQGLRQAQQSLAQIGQAAQQTGRTTSQGIDRARAALGQFTSSTRQSSQQVSSAFQGISQTFRTLPQTTEQASSGIGRLAGSFASLRGALAGIGLAVVTRALSQLGGDAIQASTQMQAMQTAFKVITGSAQGSEQALAFVRQEANRLGVDFVTAAESFKGIAAAAKGTVLEGQGAKEIFLGIAEASRVMGLSQEKTGRAFAAIQQAMAKGRLQGEELTQQLAEALPQSTQVFARALGVGTDKLLEMMKAGQVALPEMLKFGQQLRREVAGGVTGASQSFVAATARLQNAVNEMLVALGNIVTQNPRIIAAINQMAAAFPAITREIQAAGKWVDWFLEQREKLDQWIKAHPLVATILDRLIIGPDLFQGDKTQQQIQDISQALEAARQRLQELKATADQKPLDGAVGAEAQATIARTQQAIAQLQGQLQVLRARPLVEEAPTATIGIQEAQQQITAAEQRLEALRAKAANVAAGFPDLGGLSAKAIEGQIKFTEALIANFQGKLDTLQMPPLTDAQTTAEIQRVEQELTAAQQQLRALAQEADKQSVAKAFGQHTRNEIAQTEAQIASLEAQLRKLQGIKMPDVTIAPTAIEFGGMETPANKTMREQLREQLKGTIENTARLDDYKKVLADIALLQERLAQNKQLKFLSPQELQVADTQLKQLRETEKSLREGRKAPKGLKEPKGFDFAKELEKDLRSLEALQQIADATGLPIDTLQQKISLLSSALQQQLREGAKEGSASIQMLIEKLRQAYLEAGEAEANLTLENLRKQFEEVRPEDFAQRLSAATFAEAGQAVESLQNKLQLLNTQRERAAGISGDVERVKELNQEIAQLNAEMLEQNLLQIEASGLRPLEGMQKQLQALQAAREQAAGPTGSAEQVQALASQIEDLQNRILNFQIGQIPALTEALLQAGIMANDLALTAELLETALRAAGDEGFSEETKAALIQRLREVKDQIDATYATDTIQRFRDEQDAALRQFAVQQRGQTVTGQREGLIAERERLLEAQAAHPGILTEDVTQQRLIDLNAELGRTTVLGKGVELVAQGIGEAFDRSLQGVIQGTMSLSEAFENMVQSILLSIGKLLVQEGIATILRVVLSGIGAGISGGVGGGVTGGVGGGAAYGAYPGYQHGGVIRKPTVALVGEAGNELVLPMDDLPKHMIRLLGQQKATMAAQGILAQGQGRRLRWPQVALAEGAVIAPRGLSMGSSPLTSSAVNPRQETTLNNYTIVVSSQEEADRKANELRQMENTVVSIVNRELMKGSGSGMNRLLKSTLR